MPYETAKEWFYVSESSPSGLRWKKGRSRIKPGSVAGIKQSNRDYWKVGFNKKSYRVHRIIYLLQTGKDPGDLLIDHETGTHNLFQLRLATEQQNSSNKSKQLTYGGKDCLSKYKGVSKYKNLNIKKPWRASICYKGVSKFLGTYETAYEAAQAYDKAAVELFGTYARLNFPCYLKSTKEHPRPCSLSTL